MPSTPSNAPRPLPIDPELRGALLAMVGKRVPPSDAEDIVQAALTEAVASPHAPREAEALRRWLFGVAKHKVVDFHRKRGRELRNGRGDGDELDAVADGAAEPAHVEADLLRWAKERLPEGPDAERTLGWMLREGEGENLESIAQSEHVPAPRVRQRVSRLRRHLKAHWQKEVALLAALGVVVALVLVLRPAPEQPEPRIVHEDPALRAPALRDEGLALCAKAEWRACLDKLDEAAKLDPAGDAEPAVSRARQAAEAAIRPPPPPPSAAPSAAPEPPRPPVLKRFPAPKAQKPTLKEPPSSKNAPEMPKAPPLSKKGDAIEAP